MEENKNNPQIVVHKHKHYIEIGDNLSWILIMSLMIVAGLVSGFFIHFAK